MILNVTVTDRKNQYQAKTYQVETGTDPEFLAIHEAILIYVKENKYPAYVPGKSYKTWISRFKASLAK